MPRVRHIVQNVSTARRARLFGRFGEELVPALLARNGFTGIVNLNHERPNFPYADFRAERAGVRYVISVKIRNKYERTGALNGRYKLGQAAEQLAHEAEREQNATAAWLTISIEPQTYCAYFGLLSQLKRKTGVPMSSSAIREYMCLAKDQRHGLEYALIVNKYETVEPKQSIR